MALDATDMVMNHNLRLLMSQLETMEELVDHEYKPSNIKSHSSVDALFLFSSFVASKQQITHLAGQLFFHIQEYNKIKECLKIRCDTSSGPTPGPNDMRMMARRAPPIYRCPDEVLACIFEAIAEDGSHLMQPLLLVNKQFHQVVMDSPRLWTKIFLYINDRLEEANQLSKPYIKTCLLRSKNIPLDIRLDYRSIEGVHNFLYTIIYDCLIQCMEQQEVNNFLNFDMDDVDCFLYERKVDHALDLIGLLTDKERATTQRWGSLVVSLPQMDIIAGENIWKMITGTETPKLRALDINAEGIFGDTYFWDDEYRESPLKAFPDVSTVFHLSMKGVTDSLESMNLALLKTLDIQLDLNYRAISCCKSLQELTLGCTEYLQLPPNHATVIQLPLLTSLTLMGKLSILEPFTFHLPRLENLCLSKPTDLYIPYIKAPHVRLISGQENDISADDETYYLSLLPFSAITSLEIQADEVELAERYYAILCTVQRQGLLHSSLRSIEVKGVGFVDLTHRKHISV
ncbi:hypothetical protein FRC16_002273 [Serendipita sp. 398]|nr:hypothetical protein FRC16_002273 [Serendipita sp. 398]